MVLTAYPTGLQSPRLDTLIVWPSRALRLARPLSIGSAPRISRAWGGGRLALTTTRHNTDQDHAQDLMASREQP